MDLKEFREHFPQNKRKLITPEIYDLTFKTLSEDEVDSFMDSVLDFSSVLTDSRNSVKEYFNAIRFSRHIMSGSTIIDSYIRTFPDRTYKTQSTHSSSATLYHQGPLVQKILTQANIQDHMLYQPYKFKSYDALVDGLSSKNERIKMESADKLLTHIKASEPKEMKVEIDVGAKSTALEELDTKLNAITNALYTVSKTGGNIIEIAEIEETDDN